MNLRTAAWIGGVIALLAVGTATYLFIGGDSLAAIKLLLGAFLLPSLTLFAVAPWRIASRP